MTTIIATSTTPSPYNSGSYGQYVDLEFSYCPPRTNYEIDRKSFNSYLDGIQTYREPNIEKDEINYEYRETVGIAVVAIILVICAYILLL